jgi:hypothetical protein
VNIIIVECMLIKETRANVVVLVAAVCSVAAGVAVVANVRYSKRYHDNPKMIPAEA